MDLLTATKTRDERDGQVEANEDCRTGGCIMTGADESPKGKSTSREAHSWGVIRPAIEAKIGCMKVVTMGQDEDREVRADIINRTLKN